MRNASLFSYFSRTPPSAAAVKAHPRSSSSPHDSASDTPALSRTPAPTPVTESAPANTPGTGLFLPSARFFSLNALQPSLRVPVTQNVRGAVL